MHNEVSRVYRSPYYVTEMKILWSSISVYNTIAVSGKALRKNEEFITVLVKVQMAKFNTRFQIAHLYVFPYAFVHMYARYRALIC